MGSTRVTALVLLLGASVPLLAAALQPATSQFTPFSRDPRKILEGHWQSCREIDGRYGERVYDHVVNGQGQFEVHLGPRREFAIFKDVQDAHREHESPENLLKPHRVTMEGTRATQRWEIPALQLAFTAVLGGGSRLDCENWFITLQPLDKTSE